MAVARPDDAAERVGVRARRCALRRGDLRFMRNVTVLAALGGFLPITLLTAREGWGLTGIWIGLASFICIRTAVGACATAGSAGSSAGRRSPTSAGRRGDRLDLLDVPDDPGALGPLGLDDARLVRSGTWQDSRDIPRTSPIASLCTAVSGTTIRARIGISVAWVRSIGCSMATIRHRDPGSLPVSRAAAPRAGSASPRARGRRGGRGSAMSNRPGSRHHTLSPGRRQDDDGRRPAREAATPAAPKTPSARSSAVGSTDAARRGSPGGARPRRRRARQHVEEEIPRGSGGRQRPAVPAAAQVGRDLGPALVHEHGRGRVDRHLSVVGGHEQERLAVRRKVIGEPRRARRARLLRRRCGRRSAGPEWWPAQSTSST